MCTDVYGCQEERTPTPHFESNDKLKVGREEAKGICNFNTTLLPMRKELAQT
jgi:hypothetical protein